MKKVVWGVGGILLFVGVAYWLLLAQEAGRASVAEEVRYDTVTSDEYGLSFSYRVAPDGYVRIDEGRQSGNLQTLLYSYRLIAKSEYQALQDQREIREAPPIISITIYQKQPDVAAADLESGIMDYVAQDLRITEPTIVELEAATGIQYRADGLYASDVFLFTSDEYLYRMQGEFITEDDTIYKDFYELLETIEFI